jgi:hypothetical protein
MNFVPKDKDFGESANSIEIIDMDLLELISGGGGDDDPDGQGTRLDQPNFQ